MKYIYIYVCVTTCKRSAFSVNIYIYAHYIYIYIMYVAYVSIAHRYTSTSDQGEILRAHTDLIFERIKEDSKQRPEL